MAFPRHPPPGTVVRAGPGRVPLERLEGRATNGPAGEAENRMLRLWSALLRLLRRRPPVLDRVLDPERQARDARYLGIRNRLLPGPLPAGWAELGLSDAPVTGVRIASEPSVSEGLAAPPVQDTCVVCGQGIDPSSRVRVSLDLTHADGISYAQHAWAHAECFARCPETDEQRGIPW